MNRLNTLEYPEQFTLGEIAYDLKAKDVMQYGVISRSDILKARISSFRIVGV